MAQLERFRSSEEILEEINFLRRRAGLGPVVAEVEYVSERVKQEVEFLRKLKETRGY